MNGAANLDTIKVGLRIPYGLLLVAISKWLDPQIAHGASERYHAKCQELLEAALLRQSEVADRRASAYALNDGTMPDDPDWLRERPGTADMRQITIKLSPEAHAIAHKLGLRYPKPYTVPRVCEPLLCNELRSRRAEAVAAMNRAIQQMEEDGT